jgi:hypothetical protein
MNTPAQVPLTSLADWKNNKYADLNGFYNDYFLNPYWNIANSRNNTVDNNFTGNLNLTLQAAKWLTFSYRAATTVQNSKYTFTQEGEIIHYMQEPIRVIYSTPDGNGVDTVESPKSIAVSAVPQV